MAGNATKKHLSGRKWALKKKARKQALKSRKENRSK